MFLTPRSLNPVRIVQKQLLFAFCLPKPPQPRGSNRVCFRTTLTLTGAFHIKNLYVFDTEKPKPCEGWLKATLL